MKKAINVLYVISATGLLTSTVCCGVAKQLAWRNALATGFYVCAFSLLPAVAGLLLSAVVWARNNIQIK